MKRKQRILELGHNYRGYPVIREFVDETRKCFIEYEIPDFSIDIKIVDKNVTFTSGKIKKIKEDPERYS